MIRKNISLYEGDLKKIERLIEINEGNLSATIREIIDFAGVMLEKFGSLEYAKRIEVSKRGICIPDDVFKWLNSISYGCLPDESAVRCISEHIDDITSLNSLPDLVSRLGFPVKISVSMSMSTSVSKSVSTSVSASASASASADEAHRRSVQIMFEGERDVVEFVAKLVACAIAESCGLVVESASKRGSRFCLKFRDASFDISKQVQKEGRSTNAMRSIADEADSTTTVTSAASEDLRMHKYRAVRDSLLKHFGRRHVMMQEIMNRPKFWNAVINEIADWLDVQKYKYPKIYK